MNSDTAQTLARSVLKTAAGYFIARGFTDSSTAEVIVAGLAALVGVVWGVVHKNQLKAGNPELSC